MVMRISFNTESFVIVCIPSFLHIQVKFLQIYVQQTLLSVVPHWVLNLNFHVCLCVYVFLEIEMIN